VDEGGTNNSDYDDDDIYNEENTEDDNHDELQMYIVQRIIDFEDSNILKCSLCHISFVEYSCTCVDFLVKCNMCKHIHAVALYCKEMNQWCRCSLSISSITENTSTTFADIDSINITHEVNISKDNVGPESQINSTSDNREQKLRELKDRIIKSIENMDDMESLQGIEKIVFCNQPAFSQKPKQRGKNITQKRVFCSKKKVKTKV